MSAVLKTPVEIWAEIIEQVLYNPIIHRTDPFYPGCNPHYAILEWNDYHPISQYKRQRGILRLVSQSWKALVDSGPILFFENDLLDESIQAQASWKSARRIHLRVFPSTCPCIGRCLCTQCNYTVNSSSIPDDSRPCDLTSVLSGLSRGPALQADVLILARRTWVTINELIDAKTIARLFENVKALEIIGYPVAKSHIPNFLSNLTYLFISINRLYMTNTAVFPKLITLRIRVPRGDSFEVIRGWDLPQLQHLEIAHTGSNGYGTFDVIFDFLCKGWPLLVTLRLLAEDYVFMIPLNIWDYLPNLEYLGCTALQGFDHLQSTIPHQLKTLALLHPQPHHFGRRVLPEFILKCINLRSFADFHRWEDVQIYSASSHVLFSRTHTGVLCDGCIRDMGLFCESIRIRYEDRLGRSLKEFLATSKFHFGIRSVNVIL